MDSKLPVPVTCACFAGLAITRLDLETLQMELPAQAFCILEIRALPIIPAHFQLLVVLCPRIRLVTAGHMMIAPT
jgi:hypothetical protein